MQNRKTCFMKYAVLAYYLGTEAKLLLVLSEITFPRLFLARLSEPVISRVGVWKQLHLNQWLAKTLHIFS
jgi:hypothetical protein